MRSIFLLTLLLVLVSLPSLGLGKIIITANKEKIIYFDTGNLIMASRSLENGNYEAFLYEDPIWVFPPVGLPSITWNRKSDSALPNPGSIFCDLEKAYRIQENENANEKT